MLVKAFFDTNVLVYALVEDDPRKDQARELLFAGGVISVQVLNEFVSVVRRKMRMSWTEVNTALGALRIAFPDPIDLTLRTHEEGVGVAQRYGLGIYDSLIIASALEANCDVLYSEDLQDGQIIEESLTVRNPFA